jgi:ubiquinone/menaquinone biosynthesis C-methylase UbiE
MSSYIGRHAQLYDIFYGEKNYQKEADFVHTMIQTYTQPNQRKNLLELACGTGNHAFCLAKYGYEITALDYSSDMISRAKEKMSDSQANIHFRVADMRQLSALDFGQTFDLAICLFDSIGYVLHNEAIHSVFDGVYRQLNPHGLFIFEFWHAPAMLKSFDPVRVKRWKLDDREILRISETSLDISNSTSTVLYTIYEFFANQTFSLLQESQRNRFFQLQEMISFVKQHDFEVVKYFGGYDNLLTQIDEQTWHILMILRKN